MSKIKKPLNSTAPDGIAVYCGSGVYVHDFAQSAKKITLKTGGEDGALNASRPVALSALHVARAAGLGAWLVPHPAGAVVRGYQQVAA